MGNNYADIGFEPVVVEADVVDIYSRLKKAETGSESDPWIRTKHKTTKGSSAFGEAQITKGLIDGVLKEPDSYGLDQEDIGTLNFLRDQQKLMLKYGGKDMKPGYERYDYGGRGDFTDDMIPAYRKAVGKIVGGLYKKHIENGGTKDNFWRVWRFGEPESKNPKKQDERYEREYLSFLKNLNPFSAKEAYANEVPNEYADLGFEPIGVEAQRNDYSDLGFEPIAEEQTSQQQDVNSIAEVTKGALRGIVNIPGSVGGLIDQVGENIRRYGERAAFVNTGRSREDQLKRAENIYKIGQKVSEFGKTAKDYWQRVSSEGILAPDQETFQGAFMQNPSWTRGVSIVAEAVPSLGAALVTSAATGSPIAGLAFLGSIEAQQQFDEARQAGKSVDDANKIFAMSAMGTSVLESVPLTRFLKGGEGKLVKDIFAGAAQEGTEEVLQQLWQNVIAKIGYDKTRELTEGMVESFIGGAGSGGVFGGVTSGRPQIHDKNIQEAIKKGVPPVAIDAMQEAVATQMANNAEAIESAITDKPKVVIDPKTGEPLKIDAQEKENQITEEEMPAKAPEKSVEPQTQEATPEAEAEKIVPKTKAETVIPEQKIDNEKALIEEAKKYKTAEEFSKNYLNDLAKENKGIYDSSVYDKYRKMVGKPIGKDYAREQLENLSEEDIKNIADKHMEEFIRERGTRYLEWNYGDHNYLIAKDYFMKQSEKIDKERLTSIWNKAQQQKETKSEEAKAATEAKKGILNKIREIEDYTTGAQKGGQIIKTETGYIRLPSGNLKSVQDAGGPKAAMRILETTRKKISDGKPISSTAQKIIDEWTNLQENTEKVSESLGISLEAFPDVSEKEAKEILKEAEGLDEWDEEKVDRAVERLVEAQNRAEQEKKRGAGESAEWAEQELRRQIGDIFDIQKPVGDLWKGKGNTIFISLKKDRQGFASWLREKNFIESVDEAGNNVYRVVVSKRNKVTPSGQVRLELQPPIPKSLFQEKGEMFEGIQESVAKYGNTDSFYSGLKNVVQNKFPNTLRADQAIGILRKANVKKDELEFTGLIEFINSKDKFTKEEVVDYIENNKVQVETVVYDDTEKTGIIQQKRRKFEEAEKRKEQIARELGGTEIFMSGMPLRWIVKKEDGSRVDVPSQYEKELDDISETITDYYDFVYDDFADVNNSGTKYFEYTLPGGENYREVLITLPVKTKVNNKYEVKKVDGGYQVFENGEPFSGVKDTIGEAQDIANFQNRVELSYAEQRGKKGSFKSTHFDEPNILVHLRINDRTDVDRKKVLFVEELQSDWHLEGKKQGYMGGKVKTSDGKEGVSASGIPNAPFKNTWHELGLKKVIEIAVKEGYGKVAFINGQQTADRYDLSKQVDKIRYTKLDNGNYDIQVLKGGESVIQKNEQTPKQLEELIGKSPAEKIVNSDRKNGSLEGVDLKVGGEWAKKFYDDILPKAAEKYIKQWGGKIEDVVFDKDIAEGRASLKGTKGEIVGVQKGFAITPQMKNEVLISGQPLFEPSERYGKLKADEKETNPIPGNPRETDLSSAQASALRKAPLAVSFKKDGFLTFPKNKITTPEDAAFAFRFLKDTNQEHFYAVSVKDGQAVGAELITIGSYRSAAPEIYEVLGLPIFKDADAIYVVHNHPSGLIKPSREDLIFTEKLKKVVESAGIRLLGHVIIDTEKFSHIRGDNLDIETFTHKEYADTKNIDVLKKFYEWKESKDDLVAIKSAYDVYEMVKGHELSPDTALIVAMNNANKVQNMFMLPKNQLNKNNIIRLMVGSRGTSMVMVNSGKNAEDVSSLMRGLKDAGITLLDNIQPTDYGYVSFADSGKLMEGKAEYGKSALNKERLKQAIKKQIEAKKKSKGSRGASVGSFKEELVQATKRPESEIKGIYPIELIKLAKQIMGSVPIVRKMRSARGKFTGTSIKLSPELFRRGNEKQLAATLAHEIGHLVDYVPENTMNRGNLLGRVASLRSFLKRSLPRSVGQSLDTILNKKDRANARKSAENKVGPKPNKDKAEKLKEWQERVSNQYAKEISKLLDDKGLISEKQLRDEMLALSFEWRPIEGDMSGSYGAYRNSSSEIYADAISALLNNPDYVKQIAPQFYELFFEYIDRKPNFKEAYTAALMMMNGSSQDLSEARLEDRRLMFLSGEQIRESVTEKAKKVSQNMYEMMRMWFDNRHAKLLLKLQKGNKSALPTGDAAYLLQEADIWQNDAYLITHRIDNEVLKSVRDAGLNMDDFSDLLFLQRIVGRDNIKSQEEQKILDDANIEILNNLKDQGIDTADEITDREDLANPLGYTPETARSEMEYLKNKIGIDAFSKLEEATKKYRDIVFEVTKAAVEAGVYNKEVFDKILEPNKDTYVAFGVLDYISPNVSAGIKKQKGTLKGIESPLITTTLKTVSLARLIARNKAISSAVAELQARFPDEVTDSRRKFAGGVPAGFAEPGWSPKGKRGRITYLADGRIVSKDVDIYIAEAFKQDPAWITSMGASLNKWLGNKMFKGLVITYSPAFQYFNLIRDFKRAYINLNALGYKITVAELIKRYWDALPDAKKRASGANDAIINEMLKAKALDVPFNDYNFDARDDGFARIMRRFKSMGGKPIAGGARENIINFLVKIDGAVRYVGNVIETIPKVAGYRKLREAGMDVQKTAYITRNYIGTPDYRTRGFASNITNELFVFSNIMIQGMKADLRLATRPSTASGFWWADFKINHVWKLAMIAAAMGLFGKDLEDWFDKVSEYDKTNYVIIPLGTDDNGRAVYTRIPHNEGSRLFSATLWKILTASKKENSQFGQVFSVWAGNLPSISPVLETGTGWLQYMSGRNPYDAFRGRNAINEKTWEAGGMPRLEAMVKYSFNNLGFSQFTTYDDKRDTTTEAIIKGIPFINSYTRIFKATDYGLIEKSRDIIQHEKKLSAKKSIKRYDLFEKYLKKYRAADIKKLVDENGRIKAGAPIKKDIETITKEVYGSDWRDKQKYTEKAFIRYALRKYNDPTITAVLSASSNDMKIKVLNEAQDRMSKDKFRETIRTLRNAGIISAEVIRQISEDSLRHTGP